MDSEINTDIFYKSSKKKANDDISISSSLFTSITPNNQFRNDLTDSSYLNEKLSNLHNKILESEFTTTNDSYTDDSYTDDSYTNKSSNQSGGQNYYTTETRDLPINYSESSVSIIPFDYSSELKKNSSSSSSSSHSSSPTNSSDDSSEPLPPKVWSKKKKNLNSSLKKNSKLPSKKGSKKN